MTKTRSPHPYVRRRLRTPSGSLTSTGNGPNLIVRLMNSRHICARRTLRVARGLFVSSLATLALRGIVLAACGDIDPAQAENLANLAATGSYQPVTSSSGMTTKALAEVIRKAGLPLEPSVASLPGTVEESSFDFLNGGTYLKATLDGPWRVEVVQFVRQEKRLIPIQRGRAGRESVATDVQLTIRSAETAQRYVRWLLDATSDQATWLVSSADEVPFKLPDRTDTDLKARIAAAHQDVESKIQPPRSEESGPGFVVHQDAVVARDLVRYTVKVSKLGLPSIEETTVARDLPVVYVVSD